MGPIEPHPQAGWGGTHAEARTPDLCQAMIWCHLEFIYCPNRAFAKSFITFSQDRNQNTMTNSYLKHLDFLRH